MALGLGNPWYLPKLRLFVSLPSGCTSNAMRYSPLESAGYSVFSSGLSWMPCALAASPSFVGWPPFGYVVHRGRFVARQSEIDAVLLVDDEVVRTRGHLCEHFLLGVQDDDAVRCRRDEPSLRIERKAVCPFGVFKEHRNCPALVDLVDAACSRLCEERRAVGHQDGPFTASQTVLHDRDFCSRRDDSRNRGRDGFGRRWWWRRRAAAGRCLCVE